ncbi:NuA4-domain-containing protein [Coprinellus micaceus]|uniref:Chromatin modification-related protein EAF6 n=1 Tax=Coprinellus micaceus TaxID=71717 RepID=A0A4Y7SLI7_COPMI|nr:NuA4-domain-containing protein [Coprinellus micaceus]
MAESNAVPTADDRSQYESLRKELMQALPKKRLVDKQLAQIEAQIYALEGNYLTETAAHSGGNIIQGFEGYLKNQTATRKKYEVGEQDRIFSNSSLTYQKSLDLTGDGEDTTTTDDYKQTSSGPTTVVLPPAPKNQELSLQQKRARDKEYQRRKRASASLRSTGESEEEISTSTSTSRRATKRARVADDD